MPLLTALLLTVSAGAGLPPVPAPVEAKLQLLQQCTRAVGENHAARQALAAFLPASGLETARNTEALAERAHFLASRDAWRALLRLKYDTRRVDGLLPETPAPYAASAQDESAVRARIAGSERLSNNCLLDMPEFDAAFNAPASER